MLTDVIATTEGMVAFATAATVPFIILGVSSIVYGLSDLVNIIRFRQKKDIQTPIIEDVTPIEEIKD